MESILYILIWSDQASMDIIAVFTDRKLAQQYLDKHLFKDKYAYADDYNIKEMIINPEL